MIAITTIGKQDYNDEVAWTRLKKSKKCKHKSSESEVSSGRDDDKTAAT